MCETKTTFPSFRNQDWRTVKSDTEKVNDLLTNIPTNNTTELNDLIYAGAKLVCFNIRIPLKTTERKTKPGWELRVELQIKRLRLQVRILKWSIKKFSDETEKAQQLELKKKAWGDQLRNTSKRKNTKKIPRQDQTWTKQGVPKQRKKLTIRGKMGEAISTTGRERDKKILEQNMGKIIIKKPNGNMETKLRMLEESPQVNIHPNALEATFRYPTLKPWPWWLTQVLVWKIHLHTRQTCYRNE